MPTTEPPLTDQQLAERIAEALIRWSDGNGDPKHRLLRRPGTVIANANGRAAAVLAVVQPELDRLRAERDQARTEVGAAKAAGYRQAADNAAEQVQLHGRDADAEMLIVFLQRGAELREQFAAAQATAGES